MGRVRQMVRDSLLSSLKINALFRCYFIRGLNVYFYSSCLFGSFPKPFPTVVTRVFLKTTLD